MGSSAEPLGWTPVWESAYLRYLQVFPAWWDAERKCPVGRSAFRNLYRIARTVRAGYYRKVSRGVLDPLDMFIAVNLKEFLRLLPVSGEREWAFKWGFAGGREIPSQGGGP